MQLTVNSLRAVAVVMCTPALLAAQSSASRSPRIHETRDAVYVDIDKNGATAVYPLGISPDGRIVGMYRSEPITNPYPFAYVNQTGFLLEGNRFTDIAYPFPPGGSIEMTCPLRINAEGTIVGYWATEPPFASVEGGWMWKKGTFSEIKYHGPLPADGDPTVPQITDVWSINSSGDMVGQLVYLKNREGWNGSHGWFYDDSKRQFEYFDYPEGSWTIPTDINDRGEIVGSYQPDGKNEPGPTLGFLRTKDGSFQSIAVPPEWNAQTQHATGINSRGVIIGAYVQDGLPHGYIRKNGGFTSFDPPGALGSMPNGINPAGVIVGVYISDDGAIHGYVRIPKGQM